MGSPVLSPITLELLGFKEVKERGGGGVQRTATVKDDVKLPREVQAPHLERSQFLGFEFAAYGEVGQKSDAVTPPHGIFDGRVAAEFKGDIESRERGSGPLKARLQDIARARPWFADDELFAAQGFERQGSLARRAMPDGNDQDQSIGPDGPIDEAWVVGLLPNHPDRRSTLLDVLQDRATIAHRRADMDLGKLDLERREQRREEVLTGHRACRERQIPRDKRAEPAEGLAPHHED